MSEALRLGIDPRPAVEGFRQYDQAAEQSIRKTEQLAQAVSVYERGLRDRLNSSDITRASAEYDRLHRSVADAHTEAVRMNETMVKTDATTDRSVQGVGRLNSALASMARQAAGVHPVMGQLANIVGTFALGAATTTGVLAGMAAIAFALREITKGAREAGEALDQARGRAQGLIEAAGPSQAQRDIATIGTERDRIAGMLGGFVRASGEPMRLGTMYSGVDIGAERDRLLDELRELNAELRALRESNAQNEPYGPSPEQLQALHAGRTEFRAPLQQADKNIAEVLRQAELHVRFPPQDAEDQLARMRQQLTYEEQQAEYLERQNRLYDVAERSLDRLNAREKELHEARLDREEELRAAREDAANEVLRQLAYVGSLYGAEMAQISALASMTGQLLQVDSVTGGLSSKMPGFRTMLDPATQQLYQESPGSGDRANAYGAAALTGMGWGASSGNPGVGAMAGGLYGLATADPYSAIIGAAAGFVSGLLEQGERARAAQVAWERTFEAFETMFDTFTPFESDANAAREVFNQGIASHASNLGVSGALYVESPEEARRVADMMSDMPGAIGELGRAMEALIPVWEKNIEKAEELAKIEERRFDENLEVRVLRAEGKDKEADTLALDTQQEREYQQAVDAGYDKATLARLQYLHSIEDENLALQQAGKGIRDVTSALNSPTGLNLSLYRWMGAQALPKDELAGGRPGGSHPMDHGQSQGGGGVVINITIMESQSPRETADAVITEIRRQTKLGGASPLTLETR